MDNFEYVRNYNNEPVAIGKGGYGKIYLAKNMKDNKEYAIKYISKEKMKSVGVDGSVIQREIDVHIRITHPRIIKLYSFLEDKYNYYLALEYAQKYCASLERCPKDVRCKLRDKGVSEEVSKKIVTKLIT